METWRDEEEKKPPIVSPPPKASNFVPPPPKASNWPRQSGVAAFYGGVGQNQTKLVFPYPVCLAWETSTFVKSTSCHEKVRDAALRILTRVLDHYGLDKIRELRLDRFGGCLNVRRMRGGTAFSMHSWGIAFDFDPDRNQLRWGRDRAAFARPDTKNGSNYGKKKGRYHLDARAISTGCTLSSRHSRRPVAKTIDWSREDTAPGRDPRRRVDQTEHLVPAMTGGRIVPRHDRSPR